MCSFAVVIDEVAVVYRANKFFKNALYVYNQLIYYFEDMCKETRIIALKPCQQCPPPTKKTNGLQDAYKYLHVLIFAIYGESSASHA